MKTRFVSSCVVVAMAATFAVACDETPAKRRTGTSSTAATPTPVPGVSPTATVRPTQNPNPGGGVGGSIG
ncbi:MAG: hypothetical protein FJZ01_12305 [Candidatus Sericytochromatia bacterium]|nr:hypothetical protein [Candidatus Tanganyikabacteria bacterium]